ncbi:E3 ubiquitin/ISG15 ligase TRIM25-like [Hyperolius riggenbachi]|uniref:E3 ubiquitin/ISG15 ligase TRIM25-like n=1 Tax=Hyperolius riggenbachi TaxID=752182 RepID=UPI0035A2C79E
MASADVRDELNCSICLEMYTDPVTLKCGHNFCRACIDHYLDSQEQDYAGYNCPECRATFHHRADLQKNITLCNVVLHFKSLQRKEVAETFCTYCIHSAVPAVKSCLHCEASLCDDHLIIHSKSPEHVLTDPTTSVGSRKCPTHNEIFKYYCKQDSLCICVSCRLDGEHQGHQVGSLEEASETRKVKLRKVLDNLTSKRAETETRLQRLEDLQWAIADEKTVQIIRNLICDMEIKKGELSMKIQQASELCTVTDALTILLDQEPYFWGTAEVENDSVEDLYQGLISDTAWSEETDIKFNVNTAACNVRVSSDLNTLSLSAGYQNRPDNPVRFQCNQVLSTRSFSSGRHSWEVETSEVSDFRIGVAYHSIDKRGDQSYIGDNDKSWCLCKMHSNQYSVIHNGKVNKTLHQFSSNKFRVCLDYEAGQLSFYELCEPIKLLHTFTATFTEPLFAAFGVGYYLGGDGCWLKVCG